MIKTSLIGEKEDQYPMIDELWRFFEEKGTKTVFVSIGSGKTCTADLEISEVLGCPLLHLDTPSNLKQWEETKELLRTRKISESTSLFAAPAAKKWVLHKNLVLHSSLPSFFEGTLEDTGAPLQTRTWESLLKEHCATLGLSEQNTRMDLLKLESSPYQSMILESLWQSNFRPSLLLVDWARGPDEDPKTLTTAAHLQMLGYVLAAKHGTKYLYYFTDLNYYETCSWEVPAKRFENPFVKSIAETIYPGSEGAGIQFPKKE